MYSGDTEMNITTNLSPNKWSGGNRCEVIVIHHWNDPALNPTLSGTVAWFKNTASQVSAHYVVSGDTVVKMVEEQDQAWHAMQANQFSIGIEIDPNVPGNTYKTVGELVQDIRKRRGNLPLKKHSEYVNTSCPGNIDLNRIDNESKGVDEMLTNRNHLIVLFRRFYDRDPTKKEIDDHLGKVTYERMVDILDKSPERAKLTRLITAAKKDTDTQTLEKIRKLVK